MIFLKRKYTQSQIGILLAPLLSDFPPLLSSPSGNPRMTPGTKNTLLLLILLPALSTLRLASHALHHDVQQFLRNNRREILGHIFAESRSHRTGKRKANVCGEGSESCAPHLFPLFF